MLWFSEADTRLGRDTGKETVFSVCVWGGGGGIDHTLLESYKRNTLRTERRHQGAGQWASQVNEIGLLWVWTTCSKNLPCSPRAKVENDASIKSFVAIVCQHLFEGCNGCT